MEEHYQRRVKEFTDADLGCTKDDTVIAVIGRVGVGKGTFIRSFSDRKTSVSRFQDAYTAETLDVKTYPCALKDGTNFILVKTPGYADDHTRSALALAETAAWLTVAYQRGIRLAGIVYMHMIFDDNETVLDTLRMFKRLCGDEALPAVVLATSGLKDEKDLAEFMVPESKEWQDLIDAGSTVILHDFKTKGSTKRVLNHLLKRIGTITLQLQRELVDLKLELRETKAGHDLAAEEGTIEQKDELAPGKDKKPWGFGKAARSFRDLTRSVIPTPSPLASPALHQLSNRSSETLISESKWPEPENRKRKLLQDFKFGRQYIETKIIDIMRTTHSEEESSDDDDATVHSPTDETSVKSEESTLESLMKDWSGRGQHATFEKGEAIPLEEGRELGKGGFGVVYQVKCRGVNVALKKILGPRAAQHIAPNEMDILHKLDNRHIVKLIGTYTLTPPKYETGLLIWPLAQCDLSLVLEYLDAPKAGVLSPQFRKRMNDFGLTFDDLMAIVGPDNEKIWASFGCIVNAIEYLHSQQMRHKDLKPANILVSRDGIWLTDFGAAKDFSDTQISRSESNERGTVRYWAPEMTNYDKSGRAADIFSLGCVFLETLVAIGSKHSLDNLARLRPNDRGAYHENLEYLDRWLQLFDDSTPDMKDLLGLVKRMMSKEDRERPTASKISSTLARIDFMRTVHEGRASAKPPLHGSCCTPWYIKEMHTQMQTIRHLKSKIKQECGRCAKIKEFLKEQLEPNNAPPSPPEEGSVQSRPIPEVVLNEFGEDEVKKIDT